MLIYSRWRRNHHLNIDYSPCMMFILVDSGPQQNKKDVNHQTNVDHVDAAPTWVALSVASGPCALPWVARPLAPRPPGVGRPGHGVVSCFNLRCRVLRVTRYSRGFAKDLAVKSNKCNGKYVKTRVGNGRLDHNGEGGTANNKQH